MASAVDFKPCGLSAWGFNLIVELFVENQLSVLSLCLCAGEPWAYGLESLLSPSLLSSGHNIPPVRRNVNI